VGVKAVGCKDNIIAIRIRAAHAAGLMVFLRKIFEVFEKYRTSIDMITTSEVENRFSHHDNPTHLKEIRRA